MLVFGTVTTELPALNGKAVGNLGITANTVETVGAAAVTPEDIELVGKT